MNDLARQVAAIESARGADEVLKIRMMLEKAVQDAKRWMAEGDKAVIKWMQANNVNSLEVDETKRYYIGPSKKITCRSPERTAEAVLEVCGGDLKPFCETLSSNAFKQGAVKQLVGEDTWAELYRVETVDDLKTGKPKRSLKLANDRFVVKK